MARIVVSWATDSAGVESLHLNGPGMTFEASLLGRLRGTHGEWFFVAKDGTSHGPWSNIGLARSSILILLNARYI